MNLFEKAAQLSAQHTPFAVATIVASRGSTPRSRAKMIVLEDGTTFGTIGGGLAERYVIDEAITAIRFDRSRLVSYSLDREGKQTSIAMDCGGSMEVFIEAVSPGERLVIIGGGHVSLEIARLGALGGFRVEIVEERPEFCSAERFPMATRLHLGRDLDEAMESAPVGERDFLIIATSSSDERALRHYITSGAAYIGMLGSRRKVKLLMNKLRSEGFGEELLSAVKAPVGLDIGAETPPEIALSIVSEMVMERTGRLGRPLSGERKERVIVRGGGDIATGSICRLYRAGFEVIVLETEWPTVIRRTVSFAQAVFDGTMSLEGTTARRVEGLEEIERALAEELVPVVVDPRGSLIPALKPLALVDAILAKKNLGTRRGMAPVVIGLGPGFDAGTDVDAVIETNRGHHLGRVILQGPPAENTGIPGNIAGKSAQRVIRSPETGVIEELCSIGDLVKEGDPVMAVISPEGKRTIVPSPLDGMVRGLIKGGTEVTPGFKIGDVDPRGKDADCTTISDKARAVAGGVLEALLYLTGRRKK